MGVVSSNALPGTAIRDNGREDAMRVRMEMHEVRDAARSLIHTPALPELGDPSLRELLVRNHRLIHRVTDDALHIVALIHVRWKRAWTAPRGRPGMRQLIQLIWTSGRPHGVARTVLNEVAGTILIETVRIQ